MAAPASDKWRGRGAPKGVSGTTPFLVTPFLVTPFWSRPFPLFEHFHPEETPLVSQGMSFKCDDLDNEHTPPPRSFFIRFARISRTSVLKKWGEKSPILPPPPVAPPLWQLETILLYTPNSVHTYITVWNFWEDLLRETDGDALIMNGLTMNMF